MTGNVKKTIELNSLDELSGVLGTYDENLTYLSRELNLLAYVDGMKIRLEGKAEDVSCGEGVLSALVQTVRSGERIDGAKISYCIELAKEGRVGEITQLESGTVAITARGKQIKCKTVGQKTYVDAAMIVLSILPIVCVYPFVLKFFVSGLTVGSVKG